MAAGQGFKTFVTGEVLTAGDVNGYLMQGINVFTNATARDAAITAPAEGQFAFTKDNNSLWYYDGAAWVASGATGDIEGVTAGIGISGGGTSGTVTITNSMATAIDAKGDLVAGTGADTFSRLAVGANDTVLTADSTTATGLKWAAGAATANFTLLNSGSTTLPAATTYTLSGLGGNYTQFAIFLDNCSTNAANDYISVRLNGSSASNYASHGQRITVASSYSATGVFTGFRDPSAAQWYIAKMSANANSVINGGIQIFGGKTTGTKVMIAQGAASTATGADPEYYNYHGYNNALAATISSISIISSGGNFDAGSVFIYGTA